MIKLFLTLAVIGLSFASCKMEDGRTKDGSDKDEKHLNDTSERTNGSQTTGY